LTEALAVADIAEAKARLEWGARVTRIAKSAS